MQKGNVSIMNNHTVVLDLKPGDIRRIKLTNGAWTDARFSHSERAQGYGPKKRAMMRWHFVNIASGRTITIKSTAKIRPAGGAQ